MGQIGSAESDALYGLPRPHEAFSRLQLPLNNFVRVKGHDYAYPLRFPYFSGFGVIDGGASG